MVIIRKKEVTKDKVSYYYQIEGEGDWGILAYFPKKGLLRIEKFAESEYELENYSHHAFTAIMKFYDNDEYPEEKLIAWY